MNLNSIFERYNGDDDYREDAPRVWWGEFVIANEVQATNARVTALEDAVLGLLSRERNFAELLPEPEVAKSQQYLADRLSEAENSKDEEWLGEKNDPRLTERGLA
jgi:hypothetical protein